LNSFLRLLKAFVIVPDFDACQECFWLKVYLDVSSMLQVG
jgi:hypothetical protein